MSDPTPYDPHIMRMLQEEGMHGESSISEMNVIPFIDICLVLLIIVLISSAFAFQLFVFENPGSTQFNVVEANNKDGSSRLIKLYIHDEKTITLNGANVTRDSLVPQLQAAWSSGNYAAVDFRAPESLKTQEIIHVMERIRMNVDGVKMSLAILEKGAH